MVVFQSEIRQVLDRMSPVRFFIGRPEALDRMVVEDVAKTVFDLAQRRIGALIVFKRQDLLEDFLKGGVPLDGRVSQEVLSSIFLPQSPAHDGAIAIQGGRIVAMRCYLPLSDNPDLPQKYGTRHRAGIGITERSDAIALIVSEERGEVSLAVRGRIERIDNADDLKTRLESMMVSPQQKTRENWQGAFTANLAPKIISFVLVCILWVFIGGQPRAEVWMTVPLEYRNMPANMEIVGDLVNRVEVGIRGPRSLISSISSDQLKAHVDLSQSMSGVNHIRLTPDNVRAPLGTEVAKVAPSSVRIRLEDIKARAVPVKPHLVGKLPRPLRLMGVAVEPPEIVLQGPAGNLKRVREVFTEPVELGDLTEDTQMSVALEITSPQIRLAPDQPLHVTVSIRVEKGKGS
ncbi:MAG: DNA integrity scanning protein DisA nucleotide-binding domain protein [Syntrophaceae bacterium]|nr:DNA integrity scanning protein DisA nucleotide-binding domain protein [Syntrophaceae bacterium]